jgi:hypothetical protein
MVVGDITPILRHDVEKGLVVTRQLFLERWAAQGHPRNVGLAVELAMDLQQEFHPTSFVPLDDDRFQLPFMTLHILR